MHIGDSYTFTYTGNTQSFTFPCTGLFKLEAWGGEGGKGSFADSVLGGKGGYAVGYRVFNKDDLVYIQVGGKGHDGYDSEGTDSEGGFGGYNGGGPGGLHNPLSTEARNGGGGGGATHFAEDDRLLMPMGQAEFDTTGYLVAAGGGGGSGATATLDSEGYPGCTPGGDGGGLTGGNSKSYKDYFITLPGTQDGGFAFGQGGNVSAKSALRDHGNAGNGGGGSGYFGGFGGNFAGDNSDCSGAGGSSRIANMPSVRFKGVVYDPSTTSGVRTGNGEAKITLVALEGTARKYIIGG